MPNKNKLNKFVRQSHRGIAGIIVSLILIAVAVVGGISVFMFTQGFISDTSVAPPTIDVVEIFGYDTSDGDTLIPHVGGAAITINTGGADAILDGGDAFSIYIRNRGSGVVVLDSIEVYGDPYTVSTAVLCTTIVPVDGEFSVANDGALGNCGKTSIASGAEVTIYIRYDDTTNGDIALGRPIPITVITANGMEISKQITNGAQVG